MFLLSGTKRRTIKTVVSYLPKGMSGEASALISPLTDEIQLKIVLNKMEEIGETIKQQAEAEAEEAAEAAAAKAKRECRRTTICRESRGRNAKENGGYAAIFLQSIQNSKAYKVLIIDNNFTMNKVQLRSEVVFIILNLYSVMVYNFGDDYCDFLGTWGVFDTIKYNFITSINSNESIN